MSNVQSRRLIVEKAVRDRGGVELIDDGIARLAVQYMGEPDPEVAEDKRRELERELERRRRQTQVVQK